MRDDEFPKLARIYNLHRRYRDIMVDGMTLPADRFGPNAVARGDGATRLVTLRNLTWELVRYRIPLDATIGLTTTAEVEVRRLHPSERIVGRFAPGKDIEVEVAPFRALLLLVTTTPPDEPAVEGCDYELVQDVAGKPAILRLLGEPGSNATVIPRHSHSQPSTVTFAGAPLSLPVHRKLGDLMATPVPADAEALYEATCFAADNNALEIRSLARAGATRFPAVQASRDAFMHQEWMPKRGCSDRFAFDGDAATMFRVAANDRYRFGPSVATSPDRQLRIDLGSAQTLKYLVISGPKAGDLANAQVSANLVTWVDAAITPGQDTASIAMPPDAMRYVRLDPKGCDPAEITAHNTTVDRSAWRASNLFTAYAKRRATAARSATITLPEVATGSRICIALYGKHGRDGAWVAARVDGKVVGCPDRAISFDCNPWEYDGRMRKVDSGYTYYLPVDASMIGKPIELVVLTLAGGTDDYRAEAWITPGPEYRQGLELTLTR